MLKIRVCSQVLKFTRYTIQYDWEGVDYWSRIWDYHPRSSFLNSSTSREVKTSKCKRYFLQHCYISCRSAFSLLVYTPWEDSHMKGVGMLVFSLWGVNFGFQSHLGCSGHNAIIFCRKGLFQGCTRRNIKKLIYFQFALFTRFCNQSLKWSPLGVKKPPKTPYGDV